MLSRTAIGLSLLALTWSHNLAASELSADSITTEAVGSNLKITSVMGLVLDPTVSSFSATLKLEHKRGGSVIATPLNQSITYSPETRCIYSPTCVDAQDCLDGEACHYRGNGFIDIYGTCTPAAQYCPYPNQTRKECNCILSQAPIVEILIESTQAGDTFTFSVTPGSGITDSNSSNNSITITY